MSISGETVVIGAGFDDDNGENSGSAYLFQKPVTGWEDMTETAKLTASDGAQEDQFGNSVSISGDTAVAGAWSDDGCRGSGYVFDRDEGGPDSWGQVAKLTASDGASSDYFGTAVSISGDTAVIGAAFVDDDSGEDSGSAYVFRRDEGGPDSWGQLAKITASDGVAYDFFGMSVSGDGDTLVVGATDDDDNGDGSGSAYVFIEFEPVAWVYLPVVLRSAP